MPLLVFMSCQRVRLESVAELNHARELVNDLNTHLQLTLHQENTMVTGLESSRSWRPPCRSGAECADFAQICPCLLRGCQFMSSLELCSLISAKEPGVFTEHVHTRLPWYAETHQKVV